MSRRGVAVHGPAPGHAEEGPVDVVGAYADGDASPQIDARLVEACPAPIVDPGEVRSQAPTTREIVKLAR